MSAEKKPSWDTKRRPSKLREIISHLQAVKEALESESLKTAERADALAKQAMREKMDRA